MPRWSARYWCRPRCACSATGTGGRLARCSASFRPGRPNDDPSFWDTVPACCSSVQSVRLCPSTGRSGARAPPVASPSPPTTYPPIELPRDQAPHDTLTEWWYYTGHLRAADGRQYGFEFVIFQTVRGDYPVFYLGQFAVTDRGRQTFQHTSKLAQGSQIGRQDGLDLTVQDWHMRGALGQDHLQAGLDGYALDVDLTSEKPPALHDEDGVVSFEPPAIPTTTVTPDWR